jgi:hypothetical protein
MIQSNKVVYYEALSSSVALYQYKFSICIMLMLGKLCVILYSMCREQLYLRGGVLFITSRILVMDLLRKHCPVEKVSGVLVFNAHRCGDGLVEAKTCGCTSLVRVAPSRSKTEESGHLHSRLVSMECYDIIKNVMGGF